MIFHVTTSDRAQSILRTGFRPSKQRSKKRSGTSFSVSPYAAQGLLRSARRLHASYGEVGRYFETHGMPGDQIDHLRGQWETKTESAPEWKRTPGGFYLWVLGNFHPAIGGEFDSLPYNEFLWSGIGNALLQHLEETGGQVVAIAIFDPHDEYTPLYPLFPKDAIEAEWFVEDLDLLADLSGDAADIVKDPDHPLWSEEQRKYDRRLKRAGMA